MRYGLVRHIAGHLPPAIQRRQIEEAGCDLVVEEKSPTRAAIRAQFRFLFSLREGDELLVTSPDILQLATGDLVLLLQRFGQAGVTLRVVGEAAAAAVSTRGAARGLLDLLAANEAARPGRKGQLARRRAPEQTLTRYQIDYALQLRRHGASPRAIGQLFQLSPAEVVKLLSEADGSDRGVRASLILPE